MTLRDHSTIINGLLNSHENKHLADLDIIYYCGSFKLQKINKLSYKQELYNPEDLQNDCHKYKKAG